MERRSTKLTIGAVFCIVGGIMGIFWMVISVATEWSAFGDLNAILWLVLSIALGLIAIQGGRYALRRERFLWAILGGFCAIISGGLLLGIPAVILLLLSKKEFR
jgi:hypothetical protein